LSERFPLTEPVFLEVLNSQALFWVNNASDWYRVGRSGFEQDFMEELLSCISSTTVFLDIGSAQGVYSILAAKAGAEVYAVDPDPISIQSLRKNISLNPGISTNLHVLELALGEELGFDHFLIDPRGVQAASLKKTSRELTKKLVVEVQTVDNLIQTGRIQSPDVIKIDVEGAEGKVLEGMRNLLHSPTRPAHLFIEFHPQFLSKFGTSLPQILNQIEQTGYVSQFRNSSEKRKGLEHFVPK
jgi:FkbM family methyltransferase